MFWQFLPAVVGLLAVALALFGMLVDRADVRAATKKKNKPMRVYSSYRK